MIITKQIQKEFKFIPEEKKRIVIGDTMTIKKSDYLIAPQFDKNFYLGYFHYSISRNGKILKHFPDLSFVSFMRHNFYDKNNISIALENTSPIQKYNDSFFTIYNQVIVPNNNIQIFEKEWKNYKYWICYTEKQLNSLNYLINLLCEKYNIKKNIINNNIKKHNINEYEGICYRANFLNYYFDVNPSFPFKDFNINFYKQKFDYNGK